MEDDIMWAGDDAGRAGFGGRLVLSGAIAVMTLFAACQKTTPPPGSTGGRIDPYRTTDADRASLEVSMPELVAFAEDTAERLAADIAAIPRIADTPTRVVVEIGDLDNNTRTPTNDFEMVQRRLSSRLKGSNAATNVAMFVERTRRMDRIRGEVGGGNQPDLLDENLEGRRGTDQYDENLIYVLNGTFYESRRGDRVRRYYFEFELVHLKSREIVFNESYFIGQR